MVSGPAKILIGSATILAITALIGISVVSQRADVGLATIGGIIMMIPFAILGIYDVNCTSTGECTIWAWAKSLIFSSWYLFASVMVVIAVLSFKGTTSSNTSSAPAVATVTTSAPQPPATTTTETTATKTV